MRVQTPLHLHDWLATAQRYAEADHFEVNCPGGWQRQRIHRPEAGLVLVDCCEG